MLFFNPKAYCSNVECVSVSRTNISEAQACVLQEQEREAQQSISQKQFCYMMVGVCPWASMGGSSLKKIKEPASTNL